MSPDPWEEQPPEPPPAKSDPVEDVDEGAVLGGMLLSPAAIEDVLQVLTGPDFRDPRHEAIFDAIAGLAVLGQPVDAVTVADALQRDGSLQRVGGSAYLHTLIASVPTAANAGYYAQIVADRGVERRLHAAGQRITDLAAQPGAIGEKVAAAHAALLTATDTARTRNVSGRLIGADLDAYLDQLEDPQTDGILWPFLDLNLACNPLTPGQLVIVGARPAVGKTSFGLDVARHAAINQKQRVLVHTLEMSRREIQDRIVAAESRVKLANLITHKPDAADWEKISHAIARLNDAPLVVDDSERLTLTDLRQSIRRHKPALVILDYLQLCTLNPQASSRREGLEEFSRGIKVLAKAEQVPIVAMAQLNRGPELRANKRPYMSDLREAGAIEQDADLILLLHREDMHDKDSKRAGEADVIIAKQRNGATGDVPIGCQLHYARFCDLAHDW